MTLHEMNLEIARAKLEMARLQTAHDHRRYENACCAAEAIDVWDKEDLKLAWELSVQRERIAAAELEMVEGSNGSR